jgi:ADP-ribosyl-[dinitrogen reductase] hydrolase
MKKDKFLGALFGLAVGDALGTTLEFQSPGSFKPVEDIIGGGPFELKPGEWTDDTSMALCLADSLIRCSGFDKIDQLKTYCRWYDEGYLSATGTCFDIGNTTADALGNFKKFGNENSGSSNPNNAGNGSIMRLSPVVMFFASDFEKAVYYSCESSKTTHGALTTVDACRYFGALIWGALNNYNKEEILSPYYSPLTGYWQKNPLCNEIAEIAEGSYKTKNPPDIIGSGYVVKSLEAALWAFYNSDNFKEGCLKAVNLGNDADTTGAVYGQIAGAYYGFEAIPEHWRNKIAKAEIILDFAEKITNSSYFNT